MKNYIFTILLFFTYNLSAQTKMIFHKSHSGSTKTFKLALENDNLDLKKSNFGIIRIDYFEVRRLDSIIYISDTTAKFIVSIWKVSKPKEKRVIRVIQNKKPYSYNIIHEYSYPNKNYDLDNLKTLLVNKSNSINYFSILGISEEEKMKKIKFIGFENKKKNNRKGKKVKKTTSKKKKKTQKTKTEIKEDIKKEDFVPLDYHQNQPPNFPNMLIYILFGSVLFLALIAGLVMYQFRKVIY